MPTFALKRFTHQETLKSIRTDNLLALFGRYDSYFGDRGVTLTPANGEDIDYEGIARVLMSPDVEHTPPEMVDDLFFVDDMATPESMEALREEIATLPAAKRSTLALGPDPTPADVAVMVRLHAPDLLERKHAERHVESKRSFEYFQPKQANSKKLKAPTDKQLKDLEATFDDAFDEMKRGRNSRVFVFEKDEHVWFLIRRGDTCRREGTMTTSSSSSVYYRPEVFDVLRYDHRTAELSINAGTSKKICSLYREKIGLHLFGDAGHFPASSSKYKLDPLREVGEDSLVCSDVDGLESVVLKEVHYAWGGPENEIEVRKASDLFAAMKRRGRSIPKKARIIQAKFDVKFSDSKTPRVVRVRPSNVASFTYDHDAPAVEEWLRLRGFASVVGETDG